MQMVDYLLVLTPTFWLEDSIVALLKFKPVLYICYLQASPRLRFNKEGSLLAVTTNENGIKILANNDGLRLIRMLEGRAMDKNRGPSEPINSKVVSIPVCYLYIFLLISSVRNLVFPRFFNN